MFCKDKSIMALEELYFKERCTSRYGRSTFAVAIVSGVLRIRNSTCRMN